MAITGFCTYKKLFTELVSGFEGRGTDDFFKFCTEKIDSRLEMQRISKRAEEITGKKIMKTIAQAEPIDPKPSRPDYHALHGKYHCKAGKRHYRYAGAHGDEGTSEKMKTSCCYPFPPMMHWE